MTARTRWTLFVMLLLMPAIALASGNPFESIAQEIIDILTGNLARLVAIIAIAILGYMAYVGYLTWATAIRMIIGIVLVFGAAEIADLLIGAV